MARCAQSGVLALGDAHGCRNRHCGPLRREPTTPAPLKYAVPFANPYDGTIFHGPAFATLMDGARIGRNGASGTLAVERCKVPVGRQHSGLLDGAFHIVPHTAMNVWTTGSSDVASYIDATDPTVGFPHRVIWARFYRDAPVDGTVDVETRFVGSTTPTAVCRSSICGSASRASRGPTSAWSKSCWTRDLCCGQRPQAARVCR